MAEADDEAVHLATLESLEKGAVDQRAPHWVSRSLDLIKDVRVGVSARLGTTTIPISRLFELRDGEILKLDSAVDEPIDLIVEGKVVARGRVVVVNDSFGVQIEEITAVSG